MEQFGFLKCKNKQSFLKHMLPDVLPVLFACVYSPSSM